MKILLMTQYFYPEPGATTNRLLSFARIFAQKGHDVTVLCEFPSYPVGVLPKEYHYRLFKTEKFENFRVVRTFILPTARSNVLSRLLNYASYFISSFVIGVFLRRPDVIIASSPPPTVGLSAALVSIVRFVPMIGDIQDLWPEYAIAIGELRNKVAIIIGKLVESIFYWRCLALVTISNGLKEYLDKKTKGKKQVFIVRNGSSIPDMPEFPQIKANCFSRKTVNVCYAGVIGLLQPIQDVVDAAELTLTDESIRYTVIGDGVRRGNLENQVLTKNLSNMTFTGALSQKETIDLLLESDIAIVTLLDIEQFKSALPSKFFDYMAMALPIVLGVDGEAREILETNKTGLFYKSGYPEDMVKQIRWLQANPAKGKEMGLAGRQLVIESFSRSDLSVKMEKIISELIIK